jgi:hypothetical protein
MELPYDLGEAVDEIYKAGGNGSKGRSRQGKDEAKGADSAEPFPFWRVADMRALAPPSFVVERLIPAGSPSMIFAPQVTTRP